MLVNRFDPAPVIVVVPARLKVVVALETNDPVPVNAGPLIEKFEFAVRDLVAEMVMLLNVTVPVPEFVSVVAPLNVVVLFPALSVPVPVKSRFPVIRYAELG